MKRYCTCYHQIHQFPNALAEQTHDQLRAYRFNPLVGGTQQTPQGMSSSAANLEQWKQLKERELMKNRRFEQRQDKLLFAAFCVLMNFAEDIAVERKIVKKGVIQMLCAMLTRSSVDLLVLTTTFLKKLSVFEENKAVMTDTIPLLIRLLTCNADAVILSTLRLLFNLSFDPAMRDKMLRHGMLPKLVQLLKSNTRLRGRILKLMYHFSVEDR